LTEGWASVEGVPGADNRFGRSVLCPGEATRRKPREIGGLSRARRAISIDVISYLIKGYEASGAFGAFGAFATPREGRCLAPDNQYNHNKIKC